MGHGLRQTSKHRMLLNLFGVVYMVEHVIMLAFIYQDSGTYITITQTVSNSDLLCFLNKMLDWEVKQVNNYFSVKPAARADNCTGQHP